MADNETPSTAALTMDRGIALGNSLGDDGRRALHVNLASKVQSTLVDCVSSSVVYIGVAVPASVTSDPVWQISKVLTVGTVTSILYANGSGTFTNIWDNRGSLVYE